MANTTKSTGKKQAAKSSKKAATTKSGASKALAQPEPEPVVLQEAGAQEPTVQESSVPEPTVQESSAPEPSVQESTSSEKKTKSKKSDTSSKKVAKKVESKKDSNQVASQKGGAKAVKKSVKKAVKKVEKNTEPKTGPRYFKVVLEGNLDENAHGRFSGTKPKQAANKALTSIIKSKEKSGDGIDGKIKFSIIECTRGSKHKTYNYVGERVELDNPMEVIIGAKKRGFQSEQLLDKSDVELDKLGLKRIKYNYNNRVMKDKSA